MGDFSQKKVYRHYQGAYGDHMMHPGMIIGALGGP